MRRVFALGLAMGLIFGNLPARADNVKREFIMSCTYGVLAGTLVGAASLAFTNRPKDNLNRVARGASLGLYAGILLGLYVVYVIPDMAPSPSDDDSLPPSVKLDGVPLLVSPIFSDNRLDGVRADWTIRRF